VPHRDDPVVEIDEIQEVRFTGVISSDEDIDITEIQGSIPDALVILYLDSLQKHDSIPLCH
jgi:hypothetical protein